MNVPNELSYTKEHEWILVEGDEAIVGVTDHAQSELGDVVFVELPEKGSNYSAGDSFGSVESVKAVSEIYLPVSGEIVKVNRKLEDSPESINEDPYGEGWIVRVRIDDADELDDLMSSEEYLNYLKEEAGE